MNIFPIRLSDTVLDEVVANLKRTGVKAGEFLAPGDSISAEILSGTPEQARNAAKTLMVRIYPGFLHEEPASPLR
jgi:hypothetical protein